MVIIMRKILMLFLSFFMLTTIQTTTRDRFINEVKNGYKSYQILNDYDGEDYVLCVVRGVNKSKASFGIYFYSVCEGEYYCTIDDSSTSFTLKPDSNKEVYYPAMSYSSGLIVRVYNCDKELIQNVMIDKIYASSFVGTEGGNLGINFNSPKEQISYGFILVYVIGAAVIALCAIIIIIFKISKKGMFSDEARRAGIEDLHELEETYVNEELDEEDDIYDVKLEDAEDTSHNQVYERTRDYDEEIDDNRPSVKSILSSRGFNTNYPDMSVEDKNKVMVELMMMREQKVINNDEYQHEIVDLWKK